MMKILEDGLWECNCSECSEPAVRKISREGEEKKLEANLGFFISTKAVCSCLREYYSFEVYSRIATKMKKCVRDDQK